MVEAAIVDIAQKAPSAMLVVLVVIAGACARFLWSMDRNILVLKQYVEKLHGEHGTEIELLKSEHNNVVKMVTTHQTKIDNHSERLVSLEAVCKPNKRK